MKQKLYVDLYVHFFSRAVSKGRSNFSSQNRIRAFVYINVCLVVGSYQNQTFLLNFKISKTKMCSGEYWPFLYLYKL